VEINNWITTVNAKLTNKGVAARVDAVNGSIAFTSTQLGNKNVSGQPAVASLLKIESTSTKTAVMTTDLLGYKDGIAKGAGDTNFRLHVVDNSPSFQIGANQGQNMKITISDMSASALGIDKLDMSTTRGAQKAIGKLDKALAIVSSERSKIGAFENRMNYTINNLENAATNLTDSESRVRDLDMAAEMTEFTSAQVLQQAATAMLAQANASGQQVLQLLS
ncbi:MAG: flagellin, partial [Candidatus Riflebacteria bacterium]|nr:flagellin [Candidatus Riflebacteria bacterium]